MAVEGAAPPADWDLVRVAVRVGFQAARITFERYAKSADRPELKQDGSVVTETDRLIEQMMRSEFEQHAPEDGILGEEHGLVVGSSGRRWIVDPIDGTRFFTWRIPVFTNLIAYEDEHGPVLGVISMPMQQEIVFAGRGRGCWLLRGNDMELDKAVSAYVGAARELGEAVVHGSHTHTWTSDFLAALHSRSLLHSNRGDDAYGVAMLVTGRADAVVSVHTGKPWDWAPIPVIVREAGGVATDIRGGALPGDGSMLATNEELHPALLAAVSGIRRGRPWRQLREGPTRRPDQSPPQ
jgi:histidinol-phosphatase